MDNFINQVKTYNMIQDYTKIMETAQEEHKNK